LKIVGPATTCPNPDEFTSVRAGTAAGVVAQRSRIALAFPTVVASWLCAVSGSRSAERATGYPRAYNAFLEPLYGSGVRE
jgi:hypothetical protein